MLTVLFSAPYMIPALDRFAPEMERRGIKLIVPEVHERLPEAEILSYAGRFDGTICGDDHYTARVLNACAPRLKVISKWGTGIDSIDQQAAASLGIQVCRTPNAFTQPVADSVLGYILAFARRQPWLDRTMKSGLWQKIQGYSLSERCLGVIGVGNIGKAVLRRARAFSMQLLGNDIVEIPQDFIRESGVEMLPLPELLARSDYVSLNCDLNPTSYHIINSRTLEMMKPSAVLINTARGPLVCEPDLVEALASGKIAGAALDVYEHEPLPLDSPLMRMDQVFLAPHNSNSSPGAYERVHRSTLNNLYAGLGLRLEPGA
ncbi:MAG: phosphoglycerate dehydrogenase [Omnitrophica WOR_2 bacterium]